MKLYRLEKYKRGWFIGDFLPSIIRTKDVEVSVREYVKGDFEEKHYHQQADEITVIVSGKFKLNGKVLIKGDIAHIEKYEHADFSCLEDGVNVVVKLPSVLGDKFIVESPQ